MFDNLSINSRIAFYSCSQCQIELVILANGETGHSADLQTLPDGFAVNTY